MKVFRLFGICVILYTDDTDFTDSHGKSSKNPCFSVSVRVIRVQEVWLYRICRSAPPDVGYVSNVTYGMPQIMGVYHGVSQ
jgi:hypothetical protein